MCLVVSLALVSTPVVPQALSCNNLVSSCLLHKMMIIEPPEELVKNIQKSLVDFFDLANAG